MTRDVVAPTGWPRGVLTALVTPFDDHDRVDLDGLGRIVDHQIEAGAAGLVVGGGTGEFGVLTLDERRRLASHTVAAAHGRVPVIVQTGALATRDTVALSRHAEDVGANGLLVASPFGEPINWPERLAFYRSVTDSARLPIMVYNTPPAGLLTLDQVLELAALPTVSAVKDSSGDIVLVEDLVSRTDLEVYVGADSLMLAGFRAGAAGVVFGAANLVVGELTRLWQLLGDPAGTRPSNELWPAIRRLLRFLETSPNYVALVKSGCASLGWPAGPTRAPYLMPSAREVDRLVTLLHYVSAAAQASDTSPSAPVGRIG